VAKLAVLAKPFLPFTAEKLRQMILLGDHNWDDAAETLLLPAGHQLGTADLLFERIEDAVIEQQVQKLLDTKKANQQAAGPKVNPQKETIAYEDFAKMDIRTGTIIAAELVPKTKKLLKLTVDTGIDKRTVVSGIAEHYQPEQIIGQKVSILVNLAPRPLRGIESNGMILMAENSEGKLCFVSPTEDFHNGSEVK
jgi:methionyl-tRNA synthetase